MSRHDVIVAYISILYTVCTNTHSFIEYTYIVCNKRKSTTYFELVLPLCVQEHRNLPFMQELRNLFSLMVGSRRKYVDPSKAVEILKDAFKSSESQQVCLMASDKFLTCLDGV